MPRSLQPHQPQRSCSGNRVADKHLRRVVPSPSPAASSAASEHTDREHWPARRESQPSTSTVIVMSVRVFKSSYINPPQDLLAAPGASVGGYTMLPAGRRADQLEYSRLQIYILSEYSYHIAADAEPRGPRARPSTRGRPAEGDFNLGTPGPSDRTHQSTTRTLASAAALLEAGRTGIPCEFA
jgi:hypothetical protein